MKRFNPLKAIEARRNGEFTNPELRRIGPLLTDIEADVRHIKHFYLVGCGYTVGRRNPKYNRNFPGAYMVLEEEGDTPTDDGSNGPWCIVGDDIAALIDEAFNVAIDIYGVD